MNPPGIAPEANATETQTGEAPRSGFRLDRVEVLNWGTFHENVWGLSPGGSNALLTGDIGSGKSTFVDAITTLLVPPQKVSYNKAAGAESRERSARSYFFGYYKSERGESGGSTKPVQLRNDHSYSVLLARFVNEVTGRTVTLAQVFWMKDQQGQPARLFVVAQQPLSIAGNFTGFGSDVTALRRKLRALQGVELFDSFPSYSAAFRYLVGLESDQALELFNQTVSMKSVGNLTEFVREHMLEPFPVEERITALMGHFDDLRSAHDAVLRAKDQIERLTPLVASCDQWAELSEVLSQSRLCREALRPWFASQKETLLERRSSQLELDIEKSKARQSRLREQIEEQRSRRDGIVEDIAKNGGERMERLKRDVAGLQREKDERHRRAAQYNEWLAAAALTPVQNEEEFAATRHVLDSEIEGTQSRLADAQNQITDATVVVRELNERSSEIDAELKSLLQRRSNVPRQSLEMRAELCRSLNLQASELPFVGELLQVRAEDRVWEGAIERLLHNFALSLLVPDQHYARVTEWVDRTNLRGRLVYYHVRGAASADRGRPVPASLVHKLQIKTDSPFYGWVEAELWRRFDLVCCDTLDEFRRQARAITRAGQIKMNEERHEKDDRHAIDDRSRYVLGWSNEAKIAALRQQAYEYQMRGRGAVERLTALQAQSREIDDRRGKLERLTVFQSFREIAWQPLAVEIEYLQAELQSLEQQSDLLRGLQERLSALDAEIRVADETLQRVGEDQARAQERLAQALRLLEECRQVVAGAPDWMAASPVLELWAGEALGEYSLTVENCDAREREFREWLQTRIDNEQKRADRLREKIVTAMQAYRGLYPLETREADASVEAGAAYRSMLDALRSDDLPRFEQRFKELLNENTIREVANFHAVLSRERETIRERIEVINASLRQIDYNEGRYIAVEPELSTDPEIRDFQQELRACTEGSLTGSEQDEYSEAKFVQVKRIIERFRGREGTAELDKRWMKKVTDVRQWFVFSASERWRQDDAEFEHYADSGGKSGGQKEKLAYTVLAASLAYQFGLEREEAQRRSFRFVVIDEAFGRGSDDSARYGLRLFGKLGLQLLVATPLQKIHIIEPFVRSVGFVHNQDGRLSMLRNLTIEEYRAEKAARA